MKHTRSTLAFWKIGAGSTDRLPAHLLVQCPCHSNRRHGLGRRHTRRTDGKMRPLLQRHCHRISPPFRVADKACEMPVTHCKSTFYIGKTATADAASKAVLSRLLPARYNARCDLPATLGPRSAALINAPRLQTRLVCQHPPACRRHTLWQSPRIVSRRLGVLGVKRHNSGDIQRSCTFPRVVQRYVLPSRRHKTPR